MKLLTLLFLGLLIAPTAYGDSACSPKPGLPWPWEGSSHWNPCSGNVVTSMPFVVHNSQSDMAENGFGVGWRVALPYYQMNGSALKKVLSDGREIEFTDISGVYSVTDPRKSSVRITKTGLQIEERDHWLYKVIYQNLSGTDNGIYVPIQVLSRKNQTLTTISWYDNYRPNTIADLVSLRNIVFGYQNSRLNSVTGPNPKLIHYYTYSIAADLAEVSVVENHGTPAVPVLKEQRRIDMAYTNHRIICQSEPIIDTTMFTNNVASCDSSGPGKNQMAYDADGRLLSMTQPDAYAVNSITYTAARTDYSDIFQTGGFFEYSAGKVTRIANHRDEGVSISRNVGNTQETFVDQLGRATEKFYDGSGRLIQVTPQVGPQLLYGYDSENRITSLQEGPRIWTHVYYESANDYGVTVTAPNGDVQITSYNSLSQPTVDYFSMRDGANQPHPSIRNFSYFTSGARNLKRIISSDPYGYGEQVDFAYAGGELASVSEIATLFGASSTLYDSFGRVTEESNGANEYDGYRRATYHYNSVGINDSSVLYRTNGSQAGQFSVAFNGTNLNAGTVSQSGSIGTASATFEVNSITGQMKEYVLTIGSRVKTMVANFLEML